MTKILVVDDSQMVRDLMVGPLEQMGYDVLPVEPSSVDAVHARLASFRPNLMITDLQMPNCPGANLVRAVRADPRLVSTQILVFTAHRDPEAQAELAQLGINGLLFKTLSILDLMNTVAGMVKP